MFAFVWTYALPVAIFAYCYGSIIHVIRRHNKIVSGEVVRNQEVAMAATSRDQNTGQIQQQDQQQASAAGGDRFSHTEMNVLQTMIVIIACFIVCWAPGSFANFVQTLTVCLVFYLYEKKKAIFIYFFSVALNVLFYLVSRSVVTIFFGGRHNMPRPLQVDL